MFIRKYRLWWSYTEKSKRVFEHIFNSYEEAERFVKKHMTDTMYYDIEEMLFEAH